MIDDYFAQQLRTKRKKAGMTQQQLADEMNVSRKTISGWETGRNRPDIDSLRKMADIYHISLDDLVSNAKGDESTKKFRRSGIYQFTNSSLSVILAVLIAERVTQSSPLVGFWLMDGLIFFVFGLRLLTSRFGLKKHHILKSPIFLSGYGLFTITAIVIAIVYPLHIGFGFQYGIGFSGYLGLFNLILIFHHKFN